jgi:cytochrome c-type biogenesis protein CcmF
MRYKTDPRLFAYASVVIAAVQVFFLLLLNFAARSLPPGTLPAGSQVPGRKASN